MPLRGPRESPKYAPSNAREVPNYPSRSNAHNTQQAVPHRLHSAHKALARHSFTEQSQNTHRTAALQKPSGNHRSTPQKSQAIAELVFRSFSKTQNYSSEAPEVA